MAQFQGSVKGFLCISIAGQHILPPIIIVRLIPLKKGIPLIRKTCIMFLDKFWLKMRNVFVSAVPTEWGWKFTAKAGETYTVSGSPAGGRAAED